MERLGRYCVELGAIERFHSRGQHLCKFIGTKKKALIKEKSTTPTGFSWYTNTAAVSLFWNTNMADVASRENTHSRADGHTSNSPRLTYYYNMETNANLKQLPVED